MVSWISSLIFPPQEPAPSGFNTSPCSISDIVTDGVTVTYGLFIPLRLDADKLRNALHLVIENKLPSAGARLAKRNGVRQYHSVNPYANALSNSD